MLLSAYIRELTPQSSAGSFSGLSSFQTLSHSKEIPSLFSKGFLSRNTLEVQPSFRNSLLNTVLYCKPQLAILFYLPHYLVSRPSRLILYIYIWLKGVMTNDITLGLLAFSGRFCYDLDHELVVVVFFL